MFCKLWEGLRRQHGPVLLLVAMTAGAALIVPSHASAQAVTGTLLGNVTDSSGAGVPGATVTVTEVQTNISRSAVSNDAGYFIFASLQNGTYSWMPSWRGSRRSSARTSRSTSTPPSAWT